MSKVIRKGSIAVAEREESQPTLTLAIGGVNFTVTPHHSSHDGSVNFQQTGKDIVLNLRSFTGTLRVTQACSSDTPKVTNLMKRSRGIETSPEASKRIRDELAKTDDIDEQSVATEIVMDEGRIEESPIKASSSPVKLLQRYNTTSSNSPSQSVDANTSQPTNLLGQPDLSQTQLSQSQSEGGEYDDVGSSIPSPAARANEFEPKKVEESPALHKDGEEQEPPEEGEDESESETQDVTMKESKFDKSSSKEEKQESPSEVKPARVSLGISPKTRKYEKPSPRWGHTATLIGNNRMLVYGGQTIENGVPVTLNDVYLYDLLAKTWSKPYSGEGVPRQWHTATYLKDRQLLISFGGEALNPKTGKVKTENQVMVLDTEIMLWYPPAVTGDVPTARSGHTATVLDNDLVVFGGVKGSKWLNTVSVLDATLWKWSTPKVTGAAPQPRSYHSAVAVGNRIVIFGGNNLDKAFDTVHLLEKSDDDSKKWKWSHPTVTGYKPKARTGHTATLLADGKTICVYGGWDPNDDELGGNDEEMIFEDSFLLDTENWTWRPNKPVHGKEAKRVGATAVLSEKDLEVFVFGGRVPGDTFTADFQTVSIGRHE